jgi:hypothetical protein
VRRESLNHVARHGEPAITFARHWAGAVLICANDLCIVCILSFMCFLESVTSFVFNARNGSIPTRASNSFKAGDPNNVTKGQPCQLIAGIEGKD